LSFLYKYRYWIGATLIVALTTTAILIISKSSKGKSVKVKNKSPKKILFVGDSVTAVKDYRSGKAITSTYPNFVRSALQPKGISVDVVAKGGETTRWMLDNLRTQLQNNKYDRIYLYGGINDAWNNSVKPQTTLDNVGAIIDLGNQNGSDVYIIQGYEPSGFMDINKIPVTRYQKSKEDNLPLIKEYEQYQTELERMQKDRKDFTLIPKVNLGSRTGDGIHPNGEGQRMIADAVLKTI